MGDRLKHFIYFQILFLSLLLLISSSVYYYAANKFQETVPIESEGFKLWAEENIDLPDDVRFTTRSTQDFYRRDPTSYKFEARWDKGYLEFYTTRNSFFVDYYFTSDNGRPVKLTTAGEKGFERMRELLHTTPSWFYERGLEVTGENWKYRLDLMDDRYTTSGIYKTAEKYEKLLLINPITILGLRPDIFGIINIIFYLLSLGILLIIFSKGFLRKEIETITSFKSVRFIVLSVLFWGGIIAVKSILKFILLLFVGYS